VGALQGWRGVVACAKVPRGCGFGGWAGAYATGSRRGFVFDCLYLIAFGPRAILLYCVSGQVIGYLPNILIHVEALCELSG